MAGWDHRTSHFAVVDVLTAALHSNTPESPTRAKERTGTSKARRLEAFAAHLGHVGRVHPMDRYLRVVLLVAGAARRVIPGPRPFSA